MAKNEGLSRREFLEKSGLAVGAVAAMPALPPRARRTTRRSRRRCRSATLGRTGRQRLDPRHGLRQPLPDVPGGPGHGRPREGGRPRASTTSTPRSTTATARARRGSGGSWPRAGRTSSSRPRSPAASRTRDAALKEVEASLKRLQTDHLDLLHLHSLGDEADLAKIEAPDGALKALYELREQKVTRFIGMTSHTDGAVMAKAIEQQRPRLRADGHEPGAGRALRGAGPARRQQEEPRRHPDEGHGPGEAAGATAGRTPRRSCATPGACPISTAVCGMPKLEHLEANVATAKAYSSPLPPAEMEKLRQQLAGRKVVLEQFFAHHHDGGWLA